MMLIFNHNIHKAIIALTLFGLGACASTPPENVVCTDSLDFRLPIETASIPEIMAAEAPTMQPGTVETAIIDAMSSADPGAHRSTPRKIAVLSGGGEFGAYGAAFFESFLAGNDIHFDVVTGVSTGALQATGIFLGGPDDLAGSVNGYAIEREEELATRRPSIAGLPLQSSIYSLDPARARFADFLTDERINRVAEAAREGRKLLVGVVEVQNGQFYAFDLTAIAASDRPLSERRQCFTEAIFASAAVPIAFPPVLFDNRQYFDGGVRASVFFDTTVTALNTLQNYDREDGKIYLFFNGYLETPAQEGLAVSLSETVARTRAIAFDQIDRESLQNVIQLSDRFDIAWARIEPGLCQEARAEAPDEDVFNAPFMACLIREGRLVGASSEPFMRIDRP